MGPATAEAPVEFSRPFKRDFHPKNISFRIRSVLSRAIFIPTMFHCGVGLLRDFHPHDISLLFRTVPRPFKRNFYPDNVFIAVSDRLHCCLGPFRRMKTVVSLVMI